MLTEITWRYLRGRTIRHVVPDGRLTGPALCGTRPFRRPYASQRYWLGVGSDEEELYLQRRTVECPRCRAALKPPEELPAVVASVERPPRWSYAEPPPGYARVARPAKDWRVQAGSGCRAAAGGGHHACGEPSVAALNRHGKGGCDVWWPYCPEHMYGRWVEGDQVLGWVLVPEEEAARC